MRIAVIALLAGVGLFFAVTRTQVGRDGLRRQIEQQFADAFEGRIEIGQLKGNLAQHLFAGDVRLYDPAGRLVVQVDSIVARPNWRSLFRRRISIGSLALIRPRFHLRYQADGTWNVQDVFRRRTPSAAGRRAPWAFDSPDLLLVDGSVRTEREATAPPVVEQGWLFDFADAEARDVQARATVEWSARSRLIDVLALSASVPKAGLALDDLQGQFVLETDQVQVNQLALRAGRTELRLDASLERLAALREGALRDLVIEADVQPGRIDYDALRRLVPRLPLAGLVDVSARLRGPLSRLVVEAVTAQHGQTRLLAEGTLLGLPDSLDFELALRGSTLAASDLRAVLPQAALPDLDHLGTLALDVTARGVAHPGRDGLAPRLQADADLDVRGAPGRLRGSVSMTQQPGQALRYTLDLDADSLDVGRLAQDPALSSALNGHLSVRGRGLSLDSLQTSLRADLRASRFAGRRADTLHVDASATGRRLEATAFARQREGSVYANAVVTLYPGRPGYRLGLITRRLDLGPLLGVDSLQSSLNTQWTLDGDGAAWDDLTGELTVAFDTSTVRWGQREGVVPPHRTLLALGASGGPEPRLRLAGDALTLSLDGDAPAQPLAALAGLWQRAFDEAARRHLDKPYDPQAVPLQAAATRPAPSLDQISRQEDARSALRAAGLDSLRLHLAFEVKRFDVLTALLPMLPPIASNLSARLHLAADADRLRLDGSFAGDSLRADPLHLSAFRAGLRASTTLEAPVERSLLLTLDAHADSARLGGQTFRRPSLSAHFQRQEGQVTLTTGRNGATGPVRLAAALDLLPDRTRLTLLDVYLALGDYVWTNPEDQPLDLFAGATVVPGLLLESQAADGGAPQRVRLRGVLSKAPQDTFFVEVENIGLRQLSAFLGMRRSVGGRMDGRLALRHAARLELTGAVAVEALALDDNVLGHVEATSRYVPGSPDVALDLRLAPMDPTQAPPGETWKENRLHVSGAFRLPRDATPQAGEDPGALDLTLDVGRADAFFFEYLFPRLVADVSGGLAGTGAIRGTFKKPRFEADLLFTGGRFDVPAFNLRYLLDGRVRVDDEAIRLDAVTLRDPTGGAATIAGAIAFNDYRFFSFDLAGDLRELQIIDVASSRELPFYGRIWASGNATLTGPLHNAALKSNDVVTSARSELFIPLTESRSAVDPGFIVFTDSTGRIPDVRPLVRRRNILARRPAGERTFTEGLEMDLNIFAPQGSTVHLVIDPLLGDVINAVGSGRIQLQRQEGDFFTFGTLTLDAGDYLFTAGEVFVRRFLINEGTIAWDGDPFDARLDIRAAYRTRASRTGLPAYVADRLQPLIPLIVQLHITGRVSSPLVDLDLAVDRSEREGFADTQFLETFLNQSDRAAEYATSVLLTNSFLLTTEGTGSDVLAGSAFNSVSQLVSSQLNRYLSQVVPNADFSFGVQGDETAQDLDVTAGLAIRLLNERLVIRGQGVYRGLGAGSDDVAAASQQGLQGEFVVEIRLSPSISVEVFYRRESDVLSESILTSTTGAGLSYSTQFPTWRRLLHRIFGKRRPAVPVDSTLVNVQGEGK